MLLAPAMLRPAASLLLLASLAVPATASASGNGRGAAPRGRTAPRRSPAEEAAHRQAEVEREIVTRHLKDRRHRVRQRGSIFHNIAVGGQRQGEYVLHQDQHITAFLDISDPQHPAFDPEREVEEEELAAIPPSRRAHILVVPNTPREHITRVIGAPITDADIEHTGAVMRQARQLATKLGIKNPHIYMNPESRVSIGYLHVHIIGERPTRPYPAAQQ
jgi:diadenosine tetraphosphate (Ap4A) HIT family hydrolase